MSCSAIAVEGLGKRYRIGPRAGYATLRERLTGLIERPLARGGRPNDADADGGADPFIWALRDVTFEIPQGAAVGVIGRNGAGKTTLLKILSRITDPTTGRARIRGRVGSLLEVGTGFHPELTGRENIFLNGAIMGMTRGEVAAKFDSIVAFAGIERFLDTPVKRYSSGMYVRLAFAVAAHLDPEVLVVDEVLAVGDAVFQKRCLDKMGEITRGEGRTVLFVSHNLASIKLLTQSCLWLDEGQVVAYGATESIVSRYLRETVQMVSGGSVDLRADRLRRATTKELARDVSFARITLTDRNGQPSSSFPEGEPIRVELLLDARRAVSELEIRFGVKTLEDVVVFKCLSTDEVASVGAGPSGVVCDIDPNLLREGQYAIELFMISGSRLVQDHIPSPAITFDMLSSPRPGDNPRQAQAGMGLVRVDYRWTRAPVEVQV